MKRILTMSVLAMVAVTGSATAGSGDLQRDLLNAQDNGKEWLDLWPRLPQLAL